ncbi:MAG: hypothetical protein ACYSO3_06030 [Planctomycetota bacterium]|jgi:hypothetical protein
MRVDGIGSNSAITVKMNTKPHPVKEGKPVESEPTLVAEAGESEEKTRGVIRLLQAGHFKGVADVRLRINFHEELQALENQNLKTTAASGFESFNQTALDQIGLLKDSGLLDDAQTAALDAFLANMQSGQAEFLAADAGSLQGLIDRWKAKLDDLTALLAPAAPAAEPQTEPLAQEVVPPEEPSEPVVEETAPEPAEVLLTESLPAEPSPLQQIVQGFQESIQQALDQLQSDLSGTSVLPPISEPSGNGRAYAKFLEIYESMQTGATADAPEPELLDMEEIVIPDASDSELQPQT